METKSDVIKLDPMRIEAKQEAPNSGDGGTWYLPGPRGSDPVYGAANKDGSGMMQNGKAILLKPYTVKGQSLVRKGLTAGEIMSAASEGALGGAAGYQNLLFCGLTSTAGFDPASVQTGRQIGTATLKVGATVAVTGGAVGLGRYLFTPTTGVGFGFWSGAAGRASLTLAGIGQIANTPVGQMITRFEESFGKSWITGFAWNIGSGAYATTAALSSQPMFYSGAYLGPTWINIEQRVLSYFGTAPMVLAPTISN